MSNNNNLKDDVNKSFDHCKGNNNYDDKDNEDPINNEKSQTREDILNKKYQNNPSNNYNPSDGNFLPYLTEEMQNMIKTLKIDSESYRTSNGDQQNILIAVINCLLYHHLNSIDIEYLKNFFFKVNEKLCENPLEI